MCQVRSGTLNGILLQRYVFCDLGGGRGEGGGEGQFTVKVKIEDEKHIYIIPAKHSYHYLSSIVIW